MTKSVRLLLIGIPLVLVVLVLGGLVFLQWTESQAVDADQQRLAAAQQSLDSAPETTLELFYQSRGKGYPGDSRSTWERLHAQALYRTDKIAELASAYGRHSEVIADYEDISFAVYRFLIDAGYRRDAEILRDRWRGRESNAFEWLEAEVSDLASQDRLSEARTLAQETKVDPAHEVLRQVLLARLADNNVARLKYLQKASELDPTNPDLRNARAFFLESNGQGRLALHEHQERVRNNPDDPQAKLDMAAFLQRNRRSAEALLIWESMASTDPRAYVRAMAWRRLIRPLRSEVSPPEGEDTLTEETMQALSSLKDGAFYDANRFPPQAASGGLEELFWLNLLDHLQNHRDSEALEAMKSYSGSPSSLNPFVFRGLCQVLTYRVNGQMDSLTCSIRLDTPPEALPIVLGKLAVLEDTRKSLRLFADEDDQSEWRIAQKTKLEERLAEPEVQETAGLLNQQAIVPAILLAGGWTEAALLMMPPEVNVPEWLQTQWIDALRRNRAPEQALAYLNEVLQATGASEEPGSVDDARQVLRAQLMLQTGQRDQAVAALKRYAAEASVAGGRAADLLARTHLEAGRFNDALKAILGNPEFAASVAGHELAARVYIKAGDNESAVDVLKRIRPHSTFAREFLAIAAWKQGDLAQAKAGLLELLGQYPERADLRQSLREVLAAESKAVATP